MRRTLETQLTQAPGTGGPGHHTFWLSTIDADGRPHMTAVGAFWVGGRYYFSGGVDSRPAGYGPPLVTEVPAGRDVRP